MAQYDVFRPTGSSVLVVDCQSRALEHLPTRFTVALLPLGNSPIPAAILNPILTLDAEEYQFAPQFAATLSLTELGERVGSIASEHYRLLDAIDLLVGSV